MSVTILKSNKIDELFIFKEILEQNGIACQIKEENVQIHQFYTAAGASLIIDDYNLYDAQSILSKYGNTQTDAALNIGVEQSEEELRLKGKLRKLNDIDAIDEFYNQYQSKGLTASKVKSIFVEERKYIIHRQNNKFDLNEFLAHLFEGKLFTYLNRNKSTKYEIEQELIERLDISNR